MRFPKNWKRLLTRENGESCKYKRLRLLWHVWSAYLMFAKTPQTNALNSFEVQAEQETNCKEKNALVLRVSSVNCTKK
ncbi:hypothetical protein JTE90_027797 [Oedothorax gibbosus]|uniref:Uncharacterized protein n=1 Tax=Oedothorax gibbosus TaxID=931172 RepID=A0AAV6V8A6_9ARAC|nr:hypothetical protein JTE90_027797 [Oedothorax gibbosus]